VNQQLTRAIVILFVICSFSAYGLDSSADGSFGSETSKFERPSEPQVTPKPYVGGMEACFSPAEACDQKLIAFIESARATLDIAIYSITLQSIVTAIESAHKRGIKVRVIVDKLQASGKFSLADEISRAKIPLKIGKFRGIMHHKYTIVDGEKMETGSYNYTTSATTSNAENQLYFEEPTIITKYQSEFELMWRDGINP
jgi:phosphatidylserine/phosphatidylglycerophosphate/cardiolipin synthase-like enzyme